MGVLSKLDGLFLVVRSDMHISVCSDIIGRVELELEFELEFEFEFEPYLFERGCGSEGGGGGSM